MHNKVVHRLREYVTELNNINLLHFNNFILYELIFKLLRKENIMKWVIICGVVLFGVHMRYSEYVFFPQSNVTSYAIFLILTFALAIIQLTFVPLSMIFILNFIGHLISLRFRGKRFVLWEIAALIFAFYIFLDVFSGYHLNLQNKLHLTLLWLGLYFFLVNLYFNYHNHRALLITSNYRIVYILFFVILLLKPISMEFRHNASVLNYDNVDTNSFIDKSNCKLIATPLKYSTDTTNMTVKTPQHFERDEDGCYIYGNLIRFSFASDYSLMIKKNLHPFKKANGKEYNEWVRLNCYYADTNCFSEDHIIIPATEDRYDAILQKQGAIHDNSD